MTVHQISAVLTATPPATVEVRDCRHGKMMYFPHDFYIGGSLKHYGEYNEDESAFLLRGIPEGGLVVEVGANIGSHTVAIAKHVGPAGRVFAFEPQRIIHQMLCGNLAINALWNVMAERVGLGAEPGVMHVPAIDYKQKGNFGGCSLHPFDQLGLAGETVEIRTLDQYCLPRCDMIKVDVEGMELGVLQGAKVTIDTYRPILYVENDRPENSEALIAFIRSLNYDLYWHTPPLFNPANWRKNPDNLFGEVASINMACVPLERKVETNLQRVGT